MVLDGCSPYLSATNHELADHVVSKAEATDAKIHVALGGVLRSASERILLNLQLVEKHMDPLWLSLLAILVVIVSVLIAKLHPFLALTLGALIVAIFTPESQLLQNALKTDGYRVRAEDISGIDSVSPTQQPFTGQNMVYRRDAQANWQLVGEVNVEINGDTKIFRGIQFQPGDYLVHASRNVTVKSAATQNAGQRIAFGFGDTCRKIGILIAMASVIGMCLLESGAAQRIVDFTRNVVGEKRTPLAFAISGFVVGIPVFFDTVFYLLMPLAKAMRLKTGGNYLLYVMSIVVGATMAHSLVPPTPGPLLVASEIEGVTVGNMIIGGLLVGLVTVTAGFLFAVFANRIWEVPLRDEDGVPNDVESHQRDESIEGSNLENRVDAAGPGILVSLLPIMLPVVLLAGKTLTDSLGDLAPGWLVAVKPLINFLGDKNIALVCAALIALATLALQRARSGGKHWFDGVQKALGSGGVIILITAAGGAFGHALRQCGIAEAIQTRFPSTQSGLTLLVLAFALTAVVRFAQGSATVAMITSVSIVAPLAAELSLGYHPVYLALAIGCGSKPLPWMNDSGFWIVGRMSGMTESETLKTFSAALTIMGIVGFLVTLAAARWLPLVPT